MKSLLFWLLAPLAGALLLFFTKPESFLGDEPFAPNIAWSFVGLLFSYLGFVFSAYALMEVRSLTHRYFAKQRLPELKAQIGVIVSRMADLAGKRLIDIRSEGFIGETRVVIKQLQKAKSPGFSEVVKRTKRHCAEVESVVRDNRDSDITMNEVSEYWELFRSLSELSDEIHAYNMESKASL